MIPLPMKAVSGPLPAGDEWVHEVKWDGMRIVAAIDGDQVRLQTANGKDATVSFPELAGLPAAVGTDAVLDGEVVAFDPGGRPDFGRLQQRMHVTSPRVAAERAAAVPVTYFVFDLLSVDGRPTTALAWSDRRRLLESLVEVGAHWQPSPVHDDGHALLDAARQNRLEGIVSKRRASHYRPGARTKEWVKVKVRNHQEFVVGGWGPGKGGRSGAIGGLLLGYHDEAGTGPLRYAGRVGSGLSSAELDRLSTRFADLVADSCPFEPPPPRAQASGATWVRPEVVVEVEFAEWTSDRRLRHPTYLGERIDVDPAQVTASP